MKTQKGFIVPVLISIIVILLVGGGTYIYLNKSKLSSNNSAIVIKNSGSTNSGGFELTINSDGSGSISLQRQANLFLNGSNITFTESKNFLAKTFDYNSLKNNIESVSNITQNGSCAKSVSFGYSETITYKGITSGDLTCPANSGIQDLNRSADKIIIQAYCYGSNSSKCSITSAVSATTDSPKLIKSNSDMSSLDIERQNNSLAILNNLKKTISFGNNTLVYDYANPTITGQLVVSDKQYEVISLPEAPGFKYAVVDIINKKVTDLFSFKTSQFVFQDDKRLVISKFFSPTLSLFIYTYGTEKMIPIPNTDAREPQTFLNGLSGEADNGIKILSSSTNSITLGIYDKNQTTPHPEILWTDYKQIGTMVVALYPNTSVPVIKSLSSNQGKSGETITVYGDNFKTDVLPSQWTKFQFIKNGEVVFNVNIHGNYNSSTQLQFLVPGANNTLNLDEVAKVPGAYKVRALNWNGNEWIPGNSVDFIITESAAG